MSYASKVIAAIILRIKGLGFLEWAGIASLIDTILTYDVKQQLFKIAAEEMSARSGLNLDPNDPFSDASVAGAISQKIGIPIRSVKDQAIILEDVDNWAAARLSEKIGFQISSLRDPAKARADMEVAALSILTQKTGIPFVPGAGGLNPDEIKAQVLTWARAQLMTEIAADANNALAVLGGAGVDCEALTAEINGKLVALGSDEKLNADALAMHVAESLVKSSVQQFSQTAAGVSKEARRRLQIRAAQDRFRSKHGNRQKYVPLGMTASFA